MAFDIDLWYNVLTQLSHTKISNVASFPISNKPHALMNQHFSWVPHPNLLCFCFEHYTTSHYSDPISNLMPLTLELVQTVFTISRHWTSMVHSCIHPWWNHSFQLYKVIFKYTTNFLVHLYISNTMHIVRLYWQHVCMLLLNHIWRCSP